MPRKKRKSDSSSVVRKSELRSAGKKVKRKKSVVRASELKVAKRIKFAKKASKSMLGLRKAASYKAIKKADPRSVVRESELGTPSKKGLDRLMKRVYKRRKKK
jgi:hypothetical protein